MSNVPPKAIRKRIELLENHLKVPARAEKISPNAWRLTCENDRVRMTVDYRHRSGGPAKWSGSTLSVDGKERALAHNLAHLAFIFHNPDETSEPTPMPPQHPISEAPAFVQQQYRAMAANFSDTDMVQVGRDNDGSWVVGIDTEGRSMRLRYTRGKTDFTMTPEIIVNGINRSYEAGNDLASVISVFSGSGGASPEAPPSSGTPTPAARVNSVETRRATVIRV